MTTDGEDTEALPADTAAPTGPTTHARPRPPSAPLEDGDRYEIGDEIGRGGMGEILAARDNQIGRDVAIKRLRPDRTSPSSITRFLREARIQGRLDHPAIPPVHELGLDTNGQPFFAMKKLSGTTLSEILRTPELRAKFPRQRLLRAFAEVCLAIEFAHTRGVLHRDLKPSNVLLGEFGEVYVLDWGVARISGDTEPELAIIERTSLGPDATASDVTLGTPGYMAPEQVTGDPPLDARADVYSLGCLLFEILAGAALHPRGEAGMRSALRGVDARPSRIVDDVAPELDELCVRATALDRDSRIGSARELGDAVQRYLDGDRDLALRRTLARDHLAEAYAAFSAGDDEDHRRSAIREAGRALALDPTLPGAAELVGRLMLEPPHTMPRAVADELAAIDVSASQRQASIGVWLHVLYASAAVLFFALGAHDVLYLGVLLGLAVVNFGISFVGARRVSTANSIATIVGNVIVVLWFGRMFSPFLVAPGIGAVALMAFAFHPMASRPSVLAMTAAAGSIGVVGLWFGELVGWLSPTMAVHGDRLRFTSPIDGIGAVPLDIALCLYAVSLVVAAGLLAGSMAGLERDARRRLHIQAWQLRQLLA
jgi:serine/threonine-protein kinase